MVPGQHHLRLNMYIAQARNGTFEVVESLGAIDPQEKHVALPALAGGDGNAPGRASAPGPAFYLTRS